MAERNWQWTYSGMSDAYYQELLAEEIGSRWRRIDWLVSCLVIGTASGSTLSGLKFWGQAEFRGIWLLIASLAAVAAVVQRINGGPAARTHQQEEVRGYFSKLRVDFQTLLAQMDMGLSPEKVDGRFATLQGEMANGMRSFKDDLLSTKALRDRVAGDAHSKSREILNRLKEVIDV